MSIVGKSQSGRACAEPASRPSAPRSVRGAKRRALTSVSTRARCWLDDAAGDHDILRSTRVQFLSVPRARQQTNRPGAAGARRTRAGRRLQRTKLKARERGDLCATVGPPVPSGPLRGFLSGAPCRVGTVPHAVRGDGLPLSSTAIVAESAARRVDGRAVRAC